MDEKQVIKDLPNLFKERKHVTLGMKLVCAFAITYYILYFGLMTYFVFNFNSVYDKVYFDDELNEMVRANYYELFIARWVLQALIITSLFLIFFKKRWGKFLFMIFTIPDDLSSGVAYLHPRAVDFAHHRAVEGYI